MRLADSLHLALLVLLIALPSPSALSAAPSSGHAPGEPWFSGSIEEAFKAAKAESKPIMVYWGAVWCPPCNELKANVFSKPRFSELMKPLVAFYLDGDQPDAQFWSDKLSVSGYPTVVLYDKDAKELTRFNEAATIAEFEEALTGALSGGATIKDALANALQGKASADQWRMLASFSWWQGDKLGQSPDELLETLTKLPTLIPETLKIERAQLAAQALSALAEAKDDKAKALAAKKIGDAPLLLDLMLESDKSIAAVRATIVNGAGGIVDFAWPMAHQDRSKVEARWLKAAAQIAADESLSVDTRLWAVNPELEFAQRRAGEEKLPPEETIAKVKAAVKLADERAKSPYERASVISGAAYMLRLVKDFDGGRALLTKELKTTETPWYYQSSFASLEKDAGRTPEALKWAEKARLSVKGRASRVQWIVEDLSLSAKLEYKGKDRRVQILAQQYYDAALSLSDGFSGRNAARATKVSDALKPFLKNSSFKKLVRKYSDKCNAAKTKACHEHFSALLTGV